MEDLRVRKEGARTEAIRTPSPRPPLRISFIEEHQRQRVVEAVGELAHELGIGAVTTERLAHLAHMGKGTFYARFGSQAGCLSYSFAVAYREVFSELAAAAAGPEPWVERLDTGLAALLEACAAKPFLAELCLIHAAGEPAAAADHDSEAAIEVLARLLADGRAEGRAALGPAYREPPAELEQLLSRGILSLVRLRLLRGSSAGLPDLRKEIFLWAAGALLGPEEAARAWRERGGDGQGS
jgi:AcrR family transcriptional regulator